MSSPGRKNRAGALRVVLDTNVVLSALVFNGGHAAVLRRAWQAGMFKPLVSSDTAYELIRVLGYPKFGLDSPAQEELLADYLPFTDAISIPTPRPRVPACRDPFDLPFLYLAIAGKADLLVTGDKDLLAVSGRLPFKIVSLSSFLETLPAA